MGTTMRPWLSLSHGRLEPHRRQNRDSLNLDAEVLTKMLGAAVFGAPGSIAKGAEAIRRWSQRHRVDVVAHDGSGLSYTDNVTTNALVRLLSAANSSSWGSALRSTLPSGGQGTLASNTPVKTIGSFWPYSTTVFDYVRRSMPYAEPQSLENDDVYAVTAYLLQLNGIIGENDVMDARTLPKVKMPNRDNFIVVYPTKR